MSLHQSRGPFLQDTVPDSSSVQADAPSTVTEELARILGLPEYGSSLILKILSIVAIFAIAWMLIKFVDRATRLWHDRYRERSTSDPARQRAATLSDLFSSAIRYIAWPMALIMSLSELGLDVAALIATAGIASLAIGFGAQTLVKDVISGIFLLFDDSIHVGDLIRVGNETGTVEYIGVRLIKVRKFNGELLMVPSGELRTFANSSIGFARAIVNIGLAYEQNLEDSLKVIGGVATRWATDNSIHTIESEPTVQAITELGPSQVNIRVVIQVKPGHQFEMERQLRRMIKAEFAEQGIEIPFPRQTVYLKSDVSESAPKTD